MKEVGQVQLKWLCKNQPKCQIVSGGSVCCFVFCQKDLGSVGCTFDWKDGLQKFDLRGPVVIPVEARGLSWVSCQLVGGPAT